MTITAPHQIIAPHVLGDVVFEDVRVPLDHRLGAQGNGFKLMLSTLATFRVSVGGAAVGVAQAALDEALAHTTSREQFGVPLARLGGIPASLATSWVEIEMARALVYRAAAAAARDPLGALHLSSMAKVGATEMASRVVDRSVQAMGRFGLVRGQQDRAALPRGAPHAHLRGLHRGDPRLAGQEAGQGPPAVTRHDR